MEKKVHEQRITYLENFLESFIQHENRIREENDQRAIENDRRAIENDRRAIEHEERIAAQNRLLFDYIEEMKRDRKRDRKQIKQNKKRIEQNEKTIKWVLTILERVTNGGGKSTQ